MWVYYSVLISTGLGHKFFFDSGGFITRQYLRKWHNNITWDSSQRKYRKKELISLLPVRDIQKDEAPYQLGLDRCSIPWSELPYTGLAHWRLARTSLSYLAFGMLYLVIPRMRASWLKSICLCQVVMSPYQNEEISISQEFFDW